MELLSFPSHELPKYVNLVMHLCYIAIISTSWFSSPSLIITRNYAWEQKTGIKSKEVGCPSKVLQSTPVQILPFGTRTCLLPLKVVLHFQA